MFGKIVGFGLCLQGFWGQPSLPQHSTQCQQTPKHPHLQLRTYTIERQPPENYLCSCSIYVISYKHNKDIQQCKNKHAMNRRVVLQIGVPFKGPASKGAVLFWGPEKGPQFRELPISFHHEGFGAHTRHMSKCSGLGVLGVQGVGFRVAVGERLVLGMGQTS